MAFSRPARITSSIVPRIPSEIADSRGTINYSKKSLASDATSEFSISLLRGYADGTE